MWIILDQSIVLNTVRLVFLLSCWAQVKSFSTVSGKNIWRMDGLVLFEPGNFYFGTFNHTLSKNKHCLNNFNNFTSNNLFLENWIRIIYSVERRTKLIYSFWGTILNYSWKRICVPGSMNSFVYVEYLRPQHAKTLLKTAANVLDYSVTLMKFPNYPEVRI